MFDTRFLRLMPIPLRDGFSKQFLFCSASWRALGEEVKIGRCRLPLSIHREPP